MKIFVLYDKSGIHSGRVLGAHLIKNLRGKAQVQKGRPKRLAMLQARGNRYDYIINVGWYRDFEVSNKTVILNVPTSIRNSSNKRKARKIFASNDVPAPKLWTSSNGITKNDLPVIGRTTHHTKGHGLWYCTSLSEVQRAARAGATHFLKYIPNTREFRVHVMAPKADLKEFKAEDFLVIKLSEKVPQKGARANEVVKNHDNGWFFGYPKDRKDPILKRIREVARKALSEFDLHWGAVDIMVSRDTGEPYVLEINSTPCLTDDSANTLEKYASSIMELLGLKERKPKKEVRKAQPTSYARKAVRSPTGNAKLRSFLRRIKT